MDRLFLAALAREIRSAVVGARVRAVRIHDVPRSLTLFLAKPGAPSELVFHLAPGTAGVFTRDAHRKPVRSRPRDAKLDKLLASSMIASVDVSELDRIFTVAVEQTRVTGKKRRVELVLELIGARKSLFIVDVESSRVVDALSVGAARLEHGDRYRAPDPPPGARLPPADAAELERRLETAGGTLDRRALLSVTGWTPLLVSEMRFAIDAGASPSAAFEDLRERLEAGEPVLYVDPDRGANVLLSPIPLAGESTLEPIAMASFDAAMAEAVRRTVLAARTDGLRRRLDAAIAKRAKKVRGLRAKLEEQRDRLPSPGELRKQGETLLAGLARAERVDERHVRLPDPFHAESRPVEIEIDPRLALPDNAERLFKRSRKAERTETELGARLEALAHELAYLDDVQVSVDAATELDELESIRQEMKEQKLIAPERAPEPARRAPERLPPRRFVTARGGVILVGRSARSNAELTFRLAKPDDVWLHASGMPGSHVVLKGSSDEDEILEAAGYAAYFSKGRNDTHVEVIVTERRNVSSIKGAPPGLVRVKSFRTVRVRPRVPE